MSWKNTRKPGTDWEYNEFGYSYNQDKDPFSGEDVFYNSVGVGTEWSNQARPSTNWTNLDKGSTTWTNVEKPA